MNWKFIKTNWFYLAMALVLLLYTVRKYPQFNPFTPAGKNNATEKLSDKNKSRNKGAALLGLIQDAPEPQKRNTESIDDKQAEAFLKRFAQVAHSEHKKFGMPTSILLAAAFVNSRAGEAESVKKTNNFFGLACGEDWENESAQMDGTCLRKYESAWASFRDFSIYLSSRDWYGSIRKSAGKDWHKWIQKLDDEEIASSKEMQKVIESYQLFELD